MQSKNILKISLGLSLYFSYTAYGFEGRDLVSQSCSRLIEYSSKPGWYRKNKPSFAQNADYVISVAKEAGQTRLDKVERVTSLQTSYLLAFNETPTSLAVSENSDAWILSAGMLTQVDFSSGSIIRSVRLPNERLSEKARGIDYNPATSQLLLAASGYGVFVLDSQNLNLIKQYEMKDLSPRPELTMAVGVRVSGDLAYILMSSRAEGGFNGVVTLKLSTGSILGQSEYNYRRAGVVDPYGKIYVENNEVIINNGGWIHTFTTKALLGSSVVIPKWHAVKKEVDGKMTYMMIEGDFLFDQENLYGCAVFPRTAPGQSLPRLVSELISTELQ